MWTQFILCVFNHEAGNGTVSLGAARYDAIDFRYGAPDDPGAASGYEGAGNWVNSTWRAMGGRTAHAYEASPREQGEVFIRHANSTDWPKSVPACGG